MITKWRRFCKFKQSTEQRMFDIFLGLHVSNNQSMISLGFGIKHFVIYGPWQDWIWHKINGAWLLLNLVLINRINKKQRMFDIFLGLHVSKNQSMISLGFGIKHFVIYGPWQDWIWHKINGAWLLLNLVLINRINKKWLGWP